MLGEVLRGEGAREAGGAEQDDVEAPSLGAALRRRHDPDSPTRGTTPSIRPSDQRTPLIRADAPATSRSTAEGPAMPLRRAVTRTVTRTLVSLTAVVGLGAAFVAGTSYGGSDHAGTGRAGGAGTDASPAAYSGSDLSLAESCDDLLAWYVERGLDLVGPYGWGGNPNIVYDFAESSAGGDAVRAPMAAQAPAPVRATNGETGTNVQEAGVDEPDVVKTDGDTLYRVQDGDLVTYDLSGAEVERLASLDLPGRHRCGQHRDPAVRRHRGRAVAAGCRRARRRGRHPAGDGRRVRPRCTRGHPHGGLRQHPGHRAAARRRGASGAPGRAARPRLHRARQPHHRVRGHPGEPRRRPRQHRRGLAPERVARRRCRAAGSSAATRSRSPTTAPPSAPLPSSASTRRRPMRPRSAAWPSTPTWPTRRPTSSTWPPARRTAGSSAAASTAWSRSRCPSRAACSRGG